MGSYNAGKKEVVAWIREHFPAGSTCLDVGACDGVYHALLGDHLNMDAVEVFAPNIDAYALRQKYRWVYNCNIKDFKFNWYDLIIFGDVLEHMTVQDAQEVLAYAGNRCADMVIAVPYMYPQGAIYGNPYEEHLQPDLTPEIFAERYPGFELLWGNDFYGYYHKATT